MRWFVFFLAPYLSATDFYVAPNGSATNAGTLASPWSLTVALSQPAALKPGDTLWLRGGTYAGRFASRLLGTAAARITVKAYQNEQPVIDSVGQSGAIIDILATGGYTDYIVGEVRGSAPQRWGLDTAQIGFGNCPGNGIGFNVLAPGTRIINNVIHDTCQSIFVSRSAPGSKVLGNILYNNGVDSPARGQGHAIYAQNDGPEWVEISGNIVLPHWDAGFHLYGSNASLNNFDCERNIILGGTHQFGGATPLQHLIFSGNMVAPAFLRFYYNNQANVDLVCNGNRFLTALSAFWWDRISAHDNTFYNPSGGVKVEVKSQPGQAISLDFDGNRYVRGLGLPDYVANMDGIGYDTFASWRVAGHDFSGSVSDPPTAPEVLYIPNSYEPKRGHIAVIRWGATTAQVDLGRFGYVAGGTYSIWDAQAMGEAPITGTWQGTPLTLRLDDPRLTLPTGDYSPQCWNADCATCNPVPAGCSTHGVFQPAKTMTVAAFLVRSVGPAPAPAPTPTPTPVPPSPPKKKKHWWEFWK